MTSSPDAPAPRFNLAAYCLERGAREQPRKPALIVIADAAAAAPAEVWTHAEIEDAVLRTAAALRAEGFLPGDRILIRLDKSSTYAILFFAAIAAGLVAVPAASQLTDRETRFLLTDSGAAAIAVPETFDSDAIPAGVRILTPADVGRLMRHAMRAGFAASAADDPAFLIYTSGTTAEPKGVLHAQRSVLGRRPMYRGWHDIRPTDRVLHAGAFNWTFSLGTGLVDPWAVGATAVVYTGEKDPAVWPRLIGATEATLFGAAPGLLRQILKYGRPERASAPALRHVLTAGEAPPPGVLEEWKERTGTEIHEGFGMSEISTYISTAPSVPRKPGMIGKPQPGRRVAIIAADGEDEPLPAGAEGLIAVDRTDPGLMLGYWRRPEEEAEVTRGRWFIGGDLGVMDAEGYVAHTGRANDLMNALGFRVSPLEVEAALGEHPNVAEVACAEVRVGTGVSVIAAFIVPRGTQGADSRAIAAFAAQRLAAYKCPREIRFVAALPRTANGKIRRSALTQLMRDGDPQRADMA